MKTIVALLTGLIFACQASALAVESPEYLQSFNPTNGFKPAQKNLAEIYLQLAGSLEYYGSPEPYLRHKRTNPLLFQAFSKPLDLVIKESRSVS